MLGKLMKHEWKAVAKILAILHLAILAMAVVGKLLLSIKILQEAALLWGTLLFIYVISVMAVGIGTHIFLAMRFYKNMYTDEGYLSFTLPVKPWEHLVSKMVIALAWIVIDGVVIAVSVLILTMYQGMGHDALDTLQTMLRDFHEAGIQPVLFGIEMVLSGVGSLIMMVLMYYFSISIGQLAKTHKLLSAVVAFVVTFNVVRIVTTLINALVLAVVMNRTSDIEELDFMTAFFGRVTGVNLAEIAVLCLIFWFTCNHIMTKRLNLD